MSFSRNTKLRIMPVMLLIAISALIAAVTLSKLYMQQPKTGAEPLTPDMKTEQTISGADPVALMRQRDKPTPKTEPLAVPMLGSSPAGQVDDINAQILKLDSRFRAESRDPKWAAATESGINAAIVGSKNDGFDVPPPSTLDVRCHTSLCSIRMGYADVDNAAQMQTKLMLGIPAPVSHARTFFLTGSNGETEVVIFAGNASNLR